jgi:hypothetical protein
MSSVKGSGVVIHDRDGGDSVTVTGGKLDVNATVSATTAESEYADDADWTDGSSKHTLVGGIFGSNTITSGDTGPILLNASGAVEVDNDYFSVLGFSTYKGNEAWSDNNSTKLHMLTGGTYNSSLPTFDDGDTGPFAMTANGKMIIDDGGGSITVDGSLTVANDSVYVDDADWTEDSSKHTLIGGACNPGVVTSGDTGAFAMTTSRELKVYDASTARTTYVGSDTWADATGSNYHTLTGGLYSASGQTFGDMETGPFAMTAAGHLMVNDGGGSLTIDGTVTANAGTNLNTSALALESGGNLAAIKTAAELVDDAIYIDDADWSDGSSKHMLVGGLYQSSPQSITDGDVGPFLTDVNGRLQVALSPTDNAVLDAIETAVEGTITVDNGGTFAVQNVPYINQNIVSGHNADIDTTAEQLGGAGSATTRRIDVQAFSTNKGTIYVGDSNVTSDGSGGGIALTAGDFYSFEVDNRNDVWVVGSQINQKMSYNYFS